ncbi:MAG: hypothetical protein JXR97_07545 [Planctomycetes bacterium]|nr:hypothetical protein [Planctomycetota bacterium]
MAAVKESSKALALLNQYRKSGKIRHPLPPLETMVYEILADGIEADEALKAFNRLSSTFINWNECRVARVTEIGRILDKIDDADGKALRVRKMLNRLFDFRGAMDLDFALEMKPSEARRCLIDLDVDVPRSIISVILFQLCPGTTIPISPEGLAVAKKHGLIGKSSSKQQLQKVLQGELDLNDGGELMQYLEFEAEGETKKAAKSKSKK